jgi:hypothetical protein
MGRPQHDIEDNGGNLDKAATAASAPPRYMVSIRPHGRAVKPVPVIFGAAETYEWVGHSTGLEPDRAPAAGIRA